LESAVRAYNLRGERYRIRSSVLLLYDNTLLGGAENGLILTTDTVYWKNFAEDSNHFPYHALKTIKANPGLLMGAVLRLNDKDIQINHGNKNELARKFAAIIRELRNLSKQHGD
jgi:hypothetical protein